MVLRIMPGLEGRKNRERFRIGKHPMMQWHINTKKKKKRVDELDAKSLLPMIVMEAA